MSIQRFKEIIDSNNLEKAKSFLDDKQSLFTVSNESEILQYCLEGKKNVDIFKLIFGRLKNEIKDKAISKNGNSILFLALDAGKDYFEVFKNYENINWSVLDKNGNNLLHHALSLKDVSEKSLDFLYEKLGGEEERTEIAFSAIEHDKNNLLKSLGIKDKGDFFVKNYKELIKKCPRRFADFVANDQSILSDYIKSHETKDSRFTSGELFNLFSKMMYLAIDYADDKLADQCLNQYKLVKNYLSFDKLGEAKRIPGLLERQNSAGNAPLDYAYKNNPEMFAKLTAKSAQLKIDVLLKSGRIQESHQINQKEKITSNIAGLFTSAGSRGWYDTGGILASLVDLTIEEGNCSPKIFVQSGTHGQQRSLSHELKEVSHCSEDVIYIRRNPVDKEGNSSPHWVVLYFFKNEEGRRNLLVVDPYGANEPSAVIKEATEGVVDNIYVSTTKIQHDGNSCGPLSSEVARAIYSQKEKLQGLLGNSSNNIKKFDIEQILPDGLINDAKETGKIDYCKGFESFNCSKIRNTHVQTAQAIGEAIIDKIPSQILINKILAGKENSRAEQTANLGSDSIEQIYDLCQGDEKSIKEIRSILKNSSTESDQVTTVNLEQINKLEQTLSEENFRPIRERLDAQIQQPQSPQLSDEQKKKIGQIRENFKSELTNPQKYEIDNSLLYKFLCSAPVGDIGKFFYSNDSVTKSEDLSKVAFAVARDGDVSKLEFFVNYDNDLIYKTDISGKSLLEAAAENFQSKVVQYIIRKHNEIYRNQDGKTADEVQSAFLGFVDNINNRKDPWAKDLAQELEKILRKKGFNESDRLKIDSIFSPYINNKEQEKEAKNFNTDNYGNLSFYADIIKSGNEEKFKAALEKIDPKYNLRSLLNSNGHNLITLTAALGTPDYWKEIEKAYSKVEGRTAISASSDDIASIGSPIQAAIIADNLPMYNHFLDAKDSFIVNKQYGTEKNNVLHTILQSNKAELLNDIFFKFKDNKKSLVKALQQVNKDNKNPLDLASEKGHYGFFEKALDVIANHNKETIRNLLIANDCRLIKSAASFGNKRVIERVFNLQDKYNEKIKNKEDQLNLLNYNNRYDKENRLEKSGLLNLACGHNNVHTVNHILELLKEKNKVSSKVSMNALTASISKDSDNKKIFDFLLGQGIDFETFSGRFTTPIHKAAECGNTYALKYFINKFPKNDILNLQDKDGKTPLHLAISNGNRKAVEFLVENGADFDKQDDKGITPFELALQDNRFSDICIDLLKYNPKATVPLYRAILSGNNSLIEKLVDQNHWILEQCSPDTLDSNLLGDETALKFALRSEINRDLTAKIADKSIKNFSKLDQKSQGELLKYGFLNDIVKSGIYNLHKEGSREAGEISKFIKSQVGKDRSFLSIVSQGTTLLHDIIGSNSFDLFTNIENVIERYAIIKKSGELEETALHAAVRSGNANIVNTILEKIGDIKFAVNEYDAKGYTPFQIAAKLGHKEIYDLLKERGGNLESKTKAGDSIAHLLILSAMKDSIDSSYEYQKLLKDYPELTRSINDKGDSLLATAAKCTDRDETPKIINQLLENEFKHKKNQLTEEDAVKLLSNAISSNNFDSVQKTVFDNMKGKVVNKIASTIAGDGTGKTAKVREIVANTIAPNSQEHINNISKTKVLSQSIKEVLSDTEEKKQSLLQNALSFLHIKAQKGSSDKVDVNTLLNFLVKDQGSYTSSKDDLFLVEEEVKVSNARKDIFVQQEELNRKFDTFPKEKEYKFWMKEGDILYQEHTKLLNNISELKVKKVICDIINKFGITDETKTKAYQSYFKQYTKESEKNGHGQEIWEEIERAFQDKGLFNVQQYGQNLAKLQPDERQIFIDLKAKEIEQSYQELSSSKNECYEQICELDNKIEDYGHNAKNLHRLKISQDVFYTNCKNLNGKSIADRVFTSNELPLIRGIILENENLWDPRFVDSEGNTLLHKLAQMVEEDNTLIGYIQPLIDQGFSLIKKNKEGKSVKDILEDVNVNNEIKQTVDNLAKTEEQINGSFKRELDSLLDSGSVDDLAKIIHNNEKGYKKYYGTLFNPFHSVVSSCFNGDLSNDYLFDKKSKCFKELLKSNDLRSALDKTDGKRCNFLHRAIEEAAANYSGGDTSKMLERILLDVARGLNGSRNLKLCNELFFKQRNSNGDNVVEALSKVEGSLNIFKKLEKEFGKNTFTDECDLNLILVNAAGSKNDDLFEHVIEKYALNRFRAPSEDGQPPLHAAVMNGDQKAVLAVLKSGANINQINSSGRTAMHELLIFLSDNSGSQEHMDLAHYLTSHGAFLGHYQEENKERGEISEVIESMEGEIKEKVLFSIARGRSDFYDMKHKLLNEAGNFIKLKNKDSPLELDLDIGGSVVFAKINNGTFKSSQFLNSDVCKSNHLTTSYFDIDGCKGYVQKSAGGKRNYIIFEDDISKGNSGKMHHPTKIKVWLSKERSIIVLVSADGTIEPAETSHKIMGVEVKDNLSEYKNKNLRERFERDYEHHFRTKEEKEEKFKKYRSGRIKELLKKVDSQDEYKNEVYIGGIPLKEALMRGRWHDHSVQKEKQTQSEEQERIQQSPENNTQNYSRRNSKGDEMGETIEDAQVDQSDVNQSKSNNVTAADADSNMSPKKSSTEVAGSEQGKSILLGTNDEKKGNFLEGVSQDIEKMAKGFKNIADTVEKSRISNKLKSELGQRFALPKIGLKEVDQNNINPESLKRLILDGLLIGEDETRKNFYKGVSQAVKEIEEGLEGIVEESIQALISSNQEVKSAQLQQVEKLNDERKKKFYEAVEGVAEALKDTMDVMEKGQISNSQEVKSAQPQQVETLTNEEKKNFYDGVKEVIKEIAEGLKGVADKSNQALKKEMKLELDIDHNDNTNVNTPDSGYGSVVSSPNQEEKGTRDSRESEKQKNNRLLDKSEIYNKVKLIMVEEYKPELNEIQMVIKSLVSAKNKKNHMGPKAREKFDKLDTYYKNEQNLRTENKSPLPPIPNNKQGRVR
ncbi:ankyrin repeat domain-containing protein [Candidatus Mesenet endosymbiont of Phosphuga atrata]|uniref:ankyrin repeat domain-containing protein n=1 Tax=Candidatus Mesenet endosymbiont of Phosphuga atrata TaxID=3066221 RepID=UPI0030CAF0AC